MRIPRFFLLSALLVAGLVAASSMAAAKGAKTGARADAKHGALKGYLEKLADELKLTAEQRQKLKPIVHEEAQKLKALRHNTSLSREQKRAKLTDLRKDIVSKIKPILTAEQVEKLKTLHHQHGGKRHAKA